MRTLSRAPESSHCSSPRFLSLLFPVPLDEALPKVAADSQGQALLWPLREGIGRGWEGTFPAPLTPKRAHEQRQALGGDQQGQEETWGSHGAP